MRTAIGLFLLFQSVSVHFRVFLIYFNVSTVSVTVKKKKKKKKKGKRAPKKNLHGFCAEYAR